MIFPLPRTTYLFIYLFSWNIEFVLKEEKQKGSDVLDLPVSN